MLALDAASFDHVGSLTAPVTLSAGPGELVALTGEPGAGKTMVLRGALGFVPARKGSVTLFQRSPWGLEHHDLLALRGRCAFASWAAPLLSNQSLRDNIALPLVMRGGTAATVDEAVDDAIRRFGLERVFARRPEDVQPRDRTLALVARALVVPAALYVLDDPELPVGARALLHERLRAGAAALVAVRYAGHFPEAARTVTMTPDGT